MKYFLQFKIKFIYDFILRVFPCLPIVINLYSNKEYSLTEVKYERSESRKWHFYKIRRVFFSVSLEIILNEDPQVPSLGKSTCKMVKFLWEGIDRGHFVINRGLSLVKSSYGFKMNLDVVEFR